jgi:hypothetical protein
VIRFDTDERKTLAAAALLKANARMLAKKARPRQVKPTAANQRQPRERDNGYLAWLRRLPCIAGMVDGGCSGPIQAAHLRFSDASRGRINPGLQSKPSDRWATALCEGHHLHGQHLTAEKLWWERLGVDPGDLAEALYAAFHSNHPGEEIIRQFAQAARKS